MKLAPFDCATRTSVRALGPASINNRLIVMIAGSLRRFFHGTRRRSLPKYPIARRSACQQAAVTRC